MEKLDGKKEKKEYWYRSKTSLNKSQNAKIKMPINCYLFAILMYITRLGASFALNLSMKTGEKCGLVQLRKRRM